jgi:deazaflavin-dependent oxidoreductase (nitroreductase family)
MIVLRAPWGQPVDRFVVRWTGFSPMTFQYAVAAGTPVRRAVADARRALLLTTVGRRSGLPRTTGLPYFELGEDVVICGTAGGGPSDPRWVDNVRAEGRVWIRIDRVLHAATAHVAEGDERAEVFEVVAGQHTGLRRYQKQAGRHGREVPLVVIRRGAPS